MMRAPVVCAGLLRAIGDDQELKNTAGSGSREGAVRAFEELEKCRIAATSPDDYTAVWGHADARRYLWQSEANREAFACTEDRPMISATMAVAELPVSCNFDPLSAEASSFEVWAAANAQVSVWWEGGASLG